MPLSTEDFIDQVRSEVGYRYESYSFPQDSKDLAFAQWVLELLFPKIDTDLAFSLLTYDEVWNIKARYKDDESGNYYIIFCHYSENPLQQKFGVEVLDNAFETYSKIVSNVDSLLEGESILSEAANAYKEDYTLSLVLALFGELEDVGYINSLLSKYNLDESKFIFYDYNHLRRSSAGVTDEIPTASVSLLFNSATEYNEGPVEAIIGNVSASSLREAIGTLTPEIYDVNLRVPLGLTKINKAMRETIASGSKFFWYYNNGITILCRGFSRQKDNPSLYVVESPRIVNGAQTTDTILSAKISANDIYVLVRIIAALPGSTQVSNNLIGKEAELQDLYLNIARFTNSQNPIETPDFRSNETVQKRLHEEFRQLGWFYEHRRGQWQNSEQNVLYRDKRIQMVDLAQRWFAFSGHPSIAITEKYSLFEEQGYYNSIFMLARSAEEYLIAHSIFDQIQQKLKENIQKAKEEEHRAVLESGKMPFTARYYLMIGRATKLAAAHMTALLGSSLQKRYGLLSRDLAQRIMPSVIGKDLVEKVYAELEDTFFRFMDRIAGDKYLTLHRVLSKQETLEELSDLFEYALVREKEKGRDLLSFNHNGES